MEQTGQLEKISDYCTINAKHVFSEEELKEQSSLLAQAVKNKSQEEANKKVAMSDFANKIKSLEAQINLHSGHINNGYTYGDRVCELYLDFENKVRIYDDKQTGEELKREPFHQSDFEKRQMRMNLEAQIGENNAAGDYAEGRDPEGGDALDQVISEKLSQAKLKPEPKNNLPDDYGKNHEIVEDPLPYRIVLAEDDDLFSPEDDDEVLPPG